MHAFDLSDIPGTTTQDTIVGKRNAHRKVHISEDSTRKWRRNDWQYIVEIRAQVLAQAKKHLCDVSIIDCDGKIIYTAHPQDKE